MTRVSILAATAALLLASAPVMAAPPSQDETLSAHVKDVEQRLKEKPKNDALKTWLDHARDYSTGERTDHPGTPPR